MRMTALLAGILFAAAQSAAIAQTEQGQPPAPQPSLQPWLVNCAGEPTTGALRCAMSQTLFAQQTGQKLIALSIGVNASGETVARLNLPHGIDLQKGAEISIDKENPEIIPIRNADQNGSYADFVLDDAKLAAFRAGTALGVAVTSINGDRIMFEISLNGFTAAFGKL